MLTIKKTDLQSICEHCNREYPNEACGILAGRDGRVERVYPMINAEPGRNSYVMDPQQQFGVMKDLRRAGLDLVSIYHTHVSSEAYPSSKDIALAYYPESVYLIVSLLDRKKPRTRGFTIADGNIVEVPIKIISNA
jgi:[CysO sulfur-carrier protein]-S-L-cysteine hydrolase